MSSERILIIDDTPANIRLLTDALEPRGHEILAAASGDAGLKIAARALPDLILLDVVMPGLNGFETCRALKENEALRDIPVLFITAKGETQNVVQGFRAGAVDYILKPFQAEEVVTRVETHLRISRLTRELATRNAELEAEVVRRRAAEDAREVSEEKLSTLTAREAQRWGLAGFIGRSKSLTRILGDIERLQHFGRTSVLITGESGTGKELVARAIHHRSPRADAPFVAVNCVAVPGELAESVFFGHVKGAFTGATTDRKGYFELADGGTLFLDEIGDMPAALQAKLLARAGGWRGHARGRDATAQSRCARACRDQCRAAREDRRRDIPSGPFLPPRAVRRRDTAAAGTARGHCARWPRISWNSSPARWVARRPRSRRMRSPCWRRIRFPATCAN